MINTVGTPIEPIEVKSFTTITQRPDCTYRCCFWYRDGKYKWRHRVLLRAGTLDEARKVKAIYEGGN